MDLKAPRYIIFEMTEKGLIVSDESKDTMAQIKSKMKVGDKSIHEVVTPERLRYLKWLGWYWGELVPVAMHTLDVLARVTKKEIASDVLKGLYISVRNPDASKNGTFSISYSGVPEKTLIDYSNFIKQMVEHITGSEFDIVTERILYNN